MQQITIKDFHSYEVVRHHRGGGKDIKVWGLTDLSVSDGYHTFEELYRHRVVLYIALCRASQRRTPQEGMMVWKSYLHSDGTQYDGWFLLGIGKKAGKQITYHIPESYWDQCSFAETLDKAPIFDSHTSDDVLERIKSL